MHTVRRFLVTIIVPALIVAIFAVGAASAHGPDGKVTLCHWASHKFVKITVSVNAEPAHFGHGDVEPDQYGDCSGETLGSQQESQQESEQQDQQGSDQENESDSPTVHAASDKSGSSHGSAGHGHND